MEMRVFMEELLSRTTQIQLIEKQPPQNAVFPASGFATLPVQFQ
jgi:cytochrome P450